MRNDRPFLLQCILLIAVLLAVLLQGFTHQVPMKPLNGFTENLQPTQLSFQTYYNGSYQKYLTKYAKQNTGFREFLIRNYNQFAYSLLDKITNNTIVKGSNDELYLTMYLDEVIGKSLARQFGNVENAKADARRNVEATQAFIDTLQRHGTRFLFVFCPSKTAIYPEYIPKSYQSQIAGFSLEEYYIELFKEYGIPHIDFYHYFREIKDRSTYPLYAKPGTHWASSTIPFVSDSLFRKLEEISGFRLPSIQYIDTNLSKQYSVMDGELEANLNLLFPLRKPAIPRPVFTLCDTVGKDRPNLLVVGDSYFTPFRQCCFVDAFKNWDFWCYNKEIYSSRPFFNGKQLRNILDAAEILEEADIVLAVVTTVHFNNYLFGFVPFATEQLAKGGYTDEEAIERIKKNILDDKAWYQGIVKQAEERGVSVEEQLLRNAEYVLGNYKQSKQQLTQ